MKFRFGHPQSALTGFWVGAAGSGLQQRACGRSHSAASGDSRNFVSTSRYRQPRIAGKRRGAVDLDELAGHWTLLDDERELIDYLIEDGHLWNHGLGEQRRYAIQHALGFKISELRPAPPAPRPRPVSHWLPAHRAGTPVPRGRARAVHPRHAVG